MLCLVLEVSVRFRYGNGEGVAIADMKPHVDRAAAQEGRKKYNGHKRHTAYQSCLLLSPACYFTSRTASTAASAFGLFVMPLIMIPVMVLVTYIGRSTQPLLSCCARQ